MTVSPINPSLQEQIDELNARISQDQSQLSQDGSQLESLMKQLQALPEGSDTQAKEVECKTNALTNQMHELGGEMSFFSSQLAALAALEKDEQSQASHGGNTNSDLHA